YLPLICLFELVSARFCQKMSKFGTIFHPQKRPETDTRSDNPFVCNKGLTPRWQKARGKLATISPINFLSLTISVTNQQSAREILRPPPGKVRGALAMLSA
ncbi:MAG: hypothetical protein ACLQOO_29555, partial [Terriglobia bacterium]